MRSARHAGPRPSQTAAHRLPPTHAPAARLPADAVGDCDVTLPRRRAAQFSSADGEALASDETTGGGQREAGPDANEEAALVRGEFEFTD